MARRLAVSWRGEVREREVRGEEGWAINWNTLCIWGHPLVEGTFLLGGFHVGEL